MKKFISIILSLLMITGVVLVSFSDDGRGKEEPLEEIKTIKYLTDSDLSKLYSCKQDIRIKDSSIVELSQADAWLLMQVARSEGGTGLDGQLWVMRTILNRLDAKWADSLWDVLVMDNQFEVVIDGSYKDADLNVESHIALSMIESGWNDTDGALYWEANTNSPDSWHKKNLQFIKEVEGNIFYR